MKTIDKRYISLMQDIYYNGTLIKARNGATRALIDTFPQLSWDLRTETFPIISIRKQNIDHYINEFLWELNGDCNINNLNNVYAPVDSRFLWQSWADNNGTIAYSYGECWRNNSLNNIDQLRDIILELKRNPLSRRLTLVTQDIDKNHKSFRNLYPTPQVSPCHPCIQFSSDGVFLNAHVFSRSQDICVGLPGDMIRYSLLTMVLAQLSGLLAQKICFSFTNLHYYLEHEQDMLNLINKYSDHEDNKPYLFIKEKKSLEDYTYTDFCLINYKPHTFKSFKLIV